MQDLEGISYWEPKSAEIIVFDKLRTILHHLTNRSLKTEKKTQQGVRVEKSALGLPASYVKKTNILKDVGEKNERVEADIQIHFAI